MRTIQMTLPRTDWAFLKRLSAKMGWQTAIVSSTPRRKVHMTEAEFRQKLERSSKQAEEGKVIRMSENESVDQFVDRLLCIQ